MQQAEVQWSHTERKIAKAALKKAYDREIEALIKNIRENASLISRLEDVWQLHDYLSAKRHDIDGKYDDRDEFLMFTLSQLVKSDLLDLSELSELEAGKRAKIKLLTRM
ncbi:MAG: hypothetical protein WA885_11860 [Phormidesmis sp.]